MKFIRIALIALLSLAVLPASAAIKYKLVGQLIQPGPTGSGVGKSNDLPYAKWSPLTARSFGVSDTVFGKFGDTLKNFNTSDFQFLRTPISGYSGASYPVPTNPDSVVCKALIKQVGADVVTFSFGILDSLSPAAGWNSYGGTATTDTTLSTTLWQTIRTTTPWVGGASYKPYLTVTTSTDTSTVGYMDCKIINRN